MVVLVDANVILDVLQERQPFLADSERILRLCAERTVTGVIAAHTIPTMFYVLRKFYPQDELRAALGLHVDLADVLGNDAEAQDLHAADKADDAGHAGPAGHGLADQRVDQRPDAADEADERHQDAEAGDESEGFHRQAGEAVHGQGDHLFQRIVALPRQTLVAGVLHRGALKAHQRDHAPEEQVHLVEVGKLLEHSGTDEPVIGVVIHHLRAHGGQKLIKALGGEALEKGVGLPAGAHAVDHIAAGQVSVHHLVLDPSAVLVFTRCIGAMQHHLAEVRVDSCLKLPRPDRPPQ